MAARQWIPSKHPRDRFGRFTRSRSSQASTADRKRAADVASGLKPKRGAKGAYLEAVAPTQHRQTVQAYTAGQYVDIHKKLRAGNIDDPQVQAMDAAMVELPDDLIVSRRVPKAQFGAVDVDALVGLKVKDAAYSPTSVNTLRATKGDVRLRIAVPKGTRAAVNPDTGEVILDRDLEMVVASVTVNPAGSTDVFLTVLPKAAASTKPGTRPAPKKTASKPRRRPAAKKPVPVQKEPPSYQERAAAAAVGEAALNSVPLSRVRAETHAGSENDAGLTVESRNALEEYLATAYMQINGGLRNAGAGRPSRQTPETLQQITHLDAAMTASRLPGDIVTWRGIRSGRGMFGQRLAGDMTGLEWREDAYVSTSTERGVSDQFVEARGVQMRILAPAGAGAVQITGRTDANGHDDEAEILLERGLGMRVAADRGVDEFDIRHLDIEVLPAENAQRPAQVISRSAAWSDASTGERAFRTAPSIRQAVMDLVKAREIWRQDAQRVERAPVAYGQDPRAGDLNYVTINAALRGHGGEIDPAASPEIVQTVNDLDLLLSGTTTKTAMVTYRGLQNPGAAIPGWRQDGDNFGLEWTAEGYQSTTTDQQVAEDFADGAMAGGTRGTTPTVARVLIPQGSQALQMSQWVSEILLPRNQRFRIVADRGIVDGVRHVDIELMTEGVLV